MKHFEHDCDVCKFLGHYQGYDLYICPNGTKTVIARASSVPSNYSSGMTFAMTSLKERIEDGRTLDEGVLALRVARLIAIDLGYLRLGYV